MPRRPRTSCTNPTCRRLVDRPGRCAQHGGEADRELKARQPWRDYGGDWPRLSAQVLEEEPNCRRCGRPSTVCDHISPRRVEIEAGRDPNRRSNLQGLCKRCHDRKTALDNELGGGGAPVNGIPR